MSDAVRMRGVAVHAGGERLLGPLDLDVAEGEHLLLVGPSGSGKTTLLRAIAGLAPTSAGTVELFGEPAGPPEKRGIGFLFQGGALWPHMSVAGTLRFTLRSSGVGAGDVPARIAELLEQVELTGFDARMPATLSGGEKQRLALARALAVRPRLLLLDEPLGPLDAELRAALLERLGALHRELGCTTIHVTHDPEEASRIATRTLHLRGGRLANGESKA